MKEIPFLKHHPLLPLPGASNNGNNAAIGPTAPAISASSGRRSRRRVVIASIKNRANDDDDGTGAIGVALTERYHHERPAKDDGSDSSNNARGLSTALVPAVSFDDNDANNNNNNNNNDNNNIASPPPPPRQFHNSNNTGTAQEETNALLRGLSSIHHSKHDNCVIFTSGIAGRPGKIRISVRDAAAAPVAGKGREEDTNGGSSMNEKSTCRDLEVDLISLLNEPMGGGGGLSSALFENPVGTSCFVTTNTRDSSNNDDMDDDDDDSLGHEDADTTESSKQYLHLRSVDPYGTVLSLDFSYPDLTPLPDQSFLLPLSPHGNHLHPHPGSSIEINQVCFPTPHTVVFALNPHLYCVDLGKVTGIATDGEAEGGRARVASAATATTRVWTNIHRVVCDPILANSVGEEAPIGGGIATPTPRKKARKSTFGSILTSLIGIGDSGYGGNGEYEYDDDDDNDGDTDGYDGGGSIPSIAALTNLPSLATPLTDSDDDDDDDDDARVATLHSDGSLRVWVAQPSRSTEGNRKGKLRIPSVQRLAVPSGSNSWMSSEIRYEDPPVPHPSAWDPTCRESDAIAFRGHCEYDSRGGGHNYEVGLYIQCYRSGRDGDGDNKSVYVFQGSIVDAHYGSGVDELPSGDVCAKMQELVLPTGTSSVADVSWSGCDGDLMVLLRRQNPNASSENAADFYDMAEGGEHDAKMALALYPSNQKQMYSKDAMLPSNMTLPYLDLNHFGYSTLGLSMEEELDRYTMDLAGDENNGGEGSDEDVMEMDDTTDSSSATAAHDAASIIAKDEAKLDRAGLLAVLQPFGRCRPSALSVHRAMLSLGLSDRYGTASTSGGDDGVWPATILSAMRKWKKRETFQQSSSTSKKGGYLSSSALVPVNGSGVSQETSPTMTGGRSIYHAFASATKSGNPSDRRTAQWDDVEGDNITITGANDVEAARRAYRSRWVRLLSEIRRQETRLDEVLCLGTAALSPFTNFLVRGCGISVLTVNDDSHCEQQGVGDTMTGKLDELSIELLACIMSNPELRQLLCRVESMLYDGASKASSLVNGWSDKSSDRELMSVVELLGGSAVASMPLDDAQIQLLGDLSRLRSNFAEAWLTAPQSASSSVSEQLVISKLPLAITPNDFTTGTGKTPPCEVEEAILSSASSLISGHLESTRLLALSRLILVVGSPQGQGNHVLVKRSALRSVLYFTALSWAIHQTTSTGKHRTVLEEHLSQEVTEVSSFHPGMAAALPLAETFVASAFRYYSNETLGGDALTNLIFSSSREPRVALRLLAPLVEYASQSIAPTSQAGIRQKRREIAAECLLTEAAAIAKHAGTAAANETSPETLWSVASKLLLVTLESMDDASQISNLIQRVGVLERHLNPMEGSMTHLPLSCGVVLDAIWDAISSITSSRETTEEIPTLWSIAFQTSMLGHLWDEALRACVHNPLADRKKSDLKRLILGMVEAGALGKIVDMSLTVNDLSASMLGDPEIIAEGTTTTGVDLFDLAAKIIEEAAYEQASVSLGSETDESAFKDRPNYWGCLYTLHASRGNWRQAAYAMDMCGKATANSVSLSNLAPQKAIVLCKSASKKIMDDACLSAQACVHALSLTDRASHRYLLPTGNNQDNIPSESRLLTEEDLERRAARALALRMYSMDEYSPDSVGDILKSTSRDTIDSLAMLGYYDQAIAVASGVSSKRKGLPGGVDLFDDALKYILCTYLVPASINSRVTIGGGRGLERSKVTQICASSSACALLGSTPQSRITPSSVNFASCVSNAQSVKALEATMAMHLLQQYTTAYSVNCRGLAHDVASAILQSGDVSKLPLWLKELCMFGSSTLDGNSGLFGHQPIPKENSIIADPAGLMRLFIKHHQYGEACDVVVSILSKQLSCSKDATSSRLPEKGSIDYVPYDLIDMLWNMIESILTTTAQSNSSGEDVKSQVKSLIKKRTCMENALEKHFESLRISEEGLKSARTLSWA